MRVRGSADVREWMGLRPAAAMAGLLCAGLIAAGPAQAQGTGQATGQGTASPALAAAPTTPESAAAILQRLSSGTAEVTVSLAELGIDRPIALSGTDARRVLFLPVPAGLPITDASVAFDARYLRGDGGRTSLVVSVDGSPLVASSPRDPQGDASAVLPVPGVARPSGFVQLQVSWASMVAEQLCFDDRSIGNVLEISPATRLTYRYDRTAVRDLTTAWSALPVQPVLLVPPGPLSPEAFDAAWRIGTVLERAGKRARIRALPRVGDEIDLSGVSVPAGLRALPAFAALAGGGRHRIANEAEIGALLMLGGAGPLNADLMVRDETLATALRAATTALAPQIQAAGAGAAPRAASPDATVRESGQNLRLEMLGSRPVITVSAGAGAQAAGALSDLWRRALTTRGATVAKAVSTVPDSGSSIPLSRLGGVPGSFDVLVRGDWTASFDLAKAISAGGMPGHLDLDISAAPGAAASAPVASVFLNDFLLGARSMDASGRPERISVDIPAYALAPTNVLRVSFQRQPMSDRCRETPQAYPVAVLPSSRITGGNAVPAVDFVGVIARMAGTADVLVPPAYLQAPAATLPRVIALASASALSPDLGTLTVAPDGTDARPQGNFLAFDVRVADIGNAVQREGDRLVLVDHANRTLLDIAGLDRLAVVQAAAAGPRVGLDYRTIGAEGPQLDKPYQLGVGDVMVLGSTGPVARIDTRAPTLDGARTAEDYIAELWMMRASWGPIAAGIAILLFALLLLLARSARRRRAADKAK